MNWEAGTPEALRVVAAKALLPHHRAALDQQAGVWADLDELEVHLDAIPHAPVAALRFAQDAKADLPLAEAAKHAAAPADRVSQVDAEVSAESYEAA